MKQLIKRFKSLNEKSSLSVIEVITPLAEYSSSVDELKRWM